MPCEAALQGTFSVYREKALKRRKVNLKRAQQPNELVTHTKGKPLLTKMFPYINSN